VAQNLGTKFARQLREDDPMAEVTADELAAAKWRDHEIRTQVFDILPLTPEEAVQVCV
jgi:hypothetical protein